MRVAVVGAGVGGLAVAVRLAAQGHEVRVFEAGAAAGGKCGRVERDGFAWDSGPSLLTMPWVVEELFAATGAPLAEELELLPVEPVTRYRFADGSRVDLSADLEHSRAALDAWSPGAGDDWARLQATCARMWLSAEPVLRGPPPWPPRLRATGRPAQPARLGPAGRPDLPPRPSPAALARIQPWRTLRGLARAHTRDPRLQMVIERFATYAGADPRRAPAVLALAGYAEHAWGAWHPRGGMYTLVEALVRRLDALGGELCLRTPARRILRDASGRAAAGVETDTGPQPADAVVAAVDAETVQGALLPRPVRPRERSVSGLALMLGLRGRTPGLVHHAIAFPADYDAEHDDVFLHRRPVHDPTVYVSATCATDPAEAPEGMENWFVLVNAPAIGDGADWAAEAERLVDRLGVRPRLVTMAVRSPADLERETGAPGGSIYGVAPHGRLGTLKRPGTRVRGVPRLWLAGGTVHPGGGLPLVLLGAATVAADIGSA
jgi:phytoene dehydrogenase-like protein